MRELYLSIKALGLGSDYVFPSPINAGRHIDNIQKAKQRIQQKAGIINFEDRDLRRSAASYMTGELGISRFIVGQVLNHVERGITRVYDRHSYDPEKRQALQAWGDLLDQIVSP